MAARGLNPSGVLRDPLSGAYSRAYLREQLQQEVERAERYREAFSLLLLDLDRLGEVNAAWGRVRGDQVVLEFVRRLRTTLRRSDLLFRYGGDSFAVLLPKAGNEQALVVAQHLLERIQAQPFPGEPPLALTLSLGLATFPIDAETAEELLERAEVRLLGAKRLGRNRALWLDPPPPPYPLADESLPLIEREEALRAFYRFLEALPEKRRGILAVVGPRGSGRSRFLAAVGLVGQEQGYALLALRPSAAMQGKPYAALAEAWNRATGRPFSFTGLEELQPALVELLRERNLRGLLVTVDDPAQLDRPTMELLGQALNAPPAPLLALVYGTDLAWVGRLPLEASLRSSVEMRPLSEEGMQVALRSLLEWDPPAEFTAWLHRETGGLPVLWRRGLFYLLEHGLLQKREEGWALKEDFRAVPLGEKLGGRGRLPLVNLPVVLTRFIDREDELAQVKALLGTTRLLTLVGPGGIGKTRLALQAAAEVWEDLAQEVCLVPINAAESSGAVVLAIAGALGFSFFGDGEPKVQLLDYLREKNLLLVLDGFERLIKHAGLLSDILEAAPALRLLVTSRERLNLDGETVLEIGGLRCPGPELGPQETASAVRLFCERARHERVGFGPSAEERPWVERICGLLQGMPLGIELAASWVGVLSCQEIAREIERSLDFPAMPAAGYPERHRSLRAVFDSSWNLLAEQERQVLAHLAVFRGGFGCQAAEQVAAATHAVLASLVDKSLLHLAPSGRYELLEVVRQYAEEKLSAIPLARGKALDRLSRYYAQFLHQREEALEDRQQREVLQEIAAEIENVRAAWDWAVERGSEEVIGRFVDSLAFFYEIRGWFQEGERAFSRAVERLRLGGEGGRQELLLAKVLARQGRFICRLGRHSQARAPLEESLAILHRQREGREMVIVLNDLGDVAFFLGDYGQARAYYEESLALGRRTGDHRRVAHALNYLGAVAYQQGEYQAARHLFQESLAIAEQAGNQYGMARALNSLGSVAYTLGDYAEAQRVYHGSLAYCKELGDLYGISRALNNLAAVAYVRGEREQARHLQRECLAIKREIGDRRGVAFALSNLGYMAYLREDYQEARRLLEASLAVFAEIGDPSGLASAMGYLGHTSLALGQDQEAQRHLDHALKMAMDVRILPVALDVLVGIAALRARAGRRGQALELLRLILGHPAGTQETRRRAERLWTELTDEPCPPESPAAGQGAQKTLEEVAGEILGEEE